MGLVTEFPIRYIPLAVRAVWGGKGDLVIGITGDDGSGKSTLAYWLAVGTTPNLNMRTQVAYFADEANPLFLYSPPKSVVWCDENPFYKRDAGKKENKWGNIIMSRMRFQNRLYIVCDRRIGRFDKDIREERIKLWFKVVEKGYAEIYEPLPIESGDPWNLDDEKKMINENGIGLVKFEPMPEEVEELYLKMKSEAWEKLKVKYKEAMEGSNNGKDGRITISQEQIGRDWYFSKKKEPNLTQKEFAKRRGLKYHQVTNAIKECDAQKVSS